MAASAGVSQGLIWVGCQWSKLKRGPHRGSNLDRIHAGLKPREGPCRNPDLEGMQIRAEDLELKAKRSLFLGEEPRISRTVEIKYCPEPAEAET